MERTIESNKIRNGYVVDGVRQYQGLDGQVVVEPERFMITKRTSPNLLVNTVTLRDRLGRQISVAAIDILDGRFESPYGPVNVQRVVSPKEFIRESRGSNKT